MLKDLLSNYLPNELVNEVLKYDAFTQCMILIKNFNKNPKKNSTRFRRIKRQTEILDEKLKINRYVYINRKIDEENFNILCEMYDNMNFNQIEYLKNQIFYL